MYLSIHLRWLDQIYLTGMVKILYSSSSFKKFAKDWRFQHITSSPEYPRFNSLAEKTVQTVKSLLEKVKDDNKDPHLMMLEAKNTPVNNYRSLAELAVGRQI